MNKRNAESKRIDKRLVHVLLQTVRELVTGLKYSIIEELEKIAIVIQIVSPIVIAKECEGIMNMLIVSCIFVMIVKYIKEVGYKLNYVSERGFPVSTKRFTRVDEDGFVEVRGDEMQEAILYLCDVEDYLKKKGLL